MTKSPRRRLAPSDVFIERAARRVVQILKEEGLVLVAADTTEEHYPNIDRSTTDPSVWSTKEFARARAVERLRSLTSPKKSNKAL